ncbi:trypsin-like peptidase domain-containing protein [Saccharopolyspora sp. NFXS83]|uniref:S1C family serine protease n=1 Tax=Saccharopolyspora sp. NFXS83 TaxID=2993560 RepID=UPI00224B0B90|nr:trypsin-like peptidase domain-containing protein [Saccharopolyspora sp. NFXS83]MCX2732028.1 trypsin-like peptidase domain-containing protein [Saccharopolyspora sp. NFXS83]
MNDEPQRGSGESSEDPRQQADNSGTAHLPQATGDTPPAGAFDGSATTQQAHPYADPAYGQPAQQPGGHAATQQQPGPYGYEQQGIGGTPGGQYPHMGAPHQHGWYQQPMGAVPVQENRAGKRNGLVATALVGALAVGLIGGGVGGFVGYRLGSSGSESQATSLEQQPPARSASVAPEGSVQGVAQKVLPSVVQLQMQSAQGSGEGSGIVLSQDGYILTNAHVAEGAGQGKLTAMFNDNRSASVRVIGSDPRSDLAVVKADITGLTPAELGRSDDLPVGSPVVAIGSPFGLSGTVTSGIVSAKDRPVRAGGQSGDQESVLNALQTDAAINPGNSGGPLVDMDGRVVGINSAIYSPGSGQEQGGSVGLGFAIPIDQAQRTAKELKDTGSATQTTLGVRIRSAEGGGAVVADVVPNGPAQQAGMQNGERITKFDGRFIEDADALVATVRSHQPGQKVQVTLTGANGGPERTIDVVLAGQKG